MNANDLRKTCLDIARKNNISVFIFCSDKETGCHYAFEPDEKTTAISNKENFIKLKTTDRKEKKQLIENAVGFVFGLKKCFEEIGKAVNFLVLKISEKYDIENILEEDYSEKY